MQADNDDKNLGGRPRMYNKPEDLEAECEKYYAHCVDNKEKMTVTGLALFLGFCEKKSIYDYMEYEGFLYPIKKALLRVENQYEKQLHENNVAGSIFALKNMGWKDKTETEFINPMPVTINEQRTYETK